MPGCAAVNCRNSGKKGFLMKRFPRDPVRRKEWFVRMERDKWFPTDTSCLCEVHFAPEMWEKTRVDGKRKLRANAVPTIFSCSHAEKKGEPPAKGAGLPSQETKSPSHLIQTTSVLPENLVMVVLEDGNEQTPSTSQMDLCEEFPIHRSSTSSKSSETSSHGAPERYEQLYWKQAIKTRNYRRLLGNYNKKLKNLEKRIFMKQFLLLRQIFTSDQILALQMKQSKKTIKFMKWSKEVVTKSLKLKFCCGDNGYSELLKQGYPLPSIRALQRRLQNLTFDSGISEEILKFLKIKVNSFEPHEKDCVLVLDEIAVTPGSTYDDLLHKYFGEVTLPQHSGIATHVLVLMLGGVNTQWRQVVGYYFTIDPVDESVLKDVISTIFKKTEEIGLNILSITSDMGPSSQALWRTWGVTADRHSRTKCKIEHPLHTDKCIYVFTNVPRLLKNIKGMLISKKSIKLSDDVVAKYKLPTSEVLADHISEVFERQKERAFELAPKLSEEDLLPSHFKKTMLSTNVVSYTVSGALKFLAEELKKPAYLTTAWFLDQVENWFQLMTSTHPSCALSKFDIDVYNGSIQFLQDFMNLFGSMSVGAKGMWETSQSGVLISTQSMLKLQAYLLDEKDYKFILTSRFSQGCLESLFCVMRKKGIVPDAVQVKNYLKLTFVSQYLQNPSRSEYEEKEREFLDL